MKKQIIILSVFSILQFQLAASDNERREEFIRSYITQEYINRHYNDFVKHTEGQERLMRRFSPRSKMIATFAGFWFGYDEFSQRLLGIGELILDKNWRERLERLRSCSEEDITYLNDVKNYALENMTAKYNTKDALNQSMHCIHEYHIDTLQKRYNLNDEYVVFLKENSKKINDDYPMYHYLSEYKEENNGELPPTIIADMILAYLFSYYKITTKGS
jgi:hypothetical protein